MKRLLLINLFLLLFICGCSKTGRQGEWIELSGCRIRVTEVNYIETWQKKHGIVVVWALENTGKEYTDVYGWTYLKDTEGNKFRSEEATGGRGIDPTEKTIRKSFFGLPKNINLHGLTWIHDDFEIVLDDPVKVNSLF